jgi:hypothetical protein
MAILLALASLAPGLAHAQAKSPAAAITVYESPT